MKMHTWDVTPKQAIALQKQLAHQVTQGKLLKKPRFIAGADAAFSRDGQYCIAAVVLWDMQSRGVIEEHVAQCKLLFPYIPGLLSFREAPAVIAALEKLSKTPDVVMYDGQGLAHPRRFGIACHIGVLLDLPTIGCAKSRLIGEYDEPELTRGSSTPLMHKGERIGTVLRTRDKVRPLFISIGHKIDLATAEQIVLDCSAGFRLPEPTRLADRRVAAAKGNRCQTRDMTYDILNQHREMT